MEYAEGQYPLFRYSTEDKQAIRKELGLKESVIEDDIDAILDWFKKQPHLVDAGIDRVIIERMLINNKGSIEKTKYRIDSYYKYKGLAPEIIQNRENILSDSTDLWKCYYQMSIPKLYKGRRVTVIKFMDTEPSMFSCEEMFRNTFMLADIRLKYDYMLGDIWVLDFKHICFGHLLRLNPITFQKTSNIFHEGLGIRIQAIHVLNSGSVVQQIINFLKQFFSPKLIDRTILHPSLDDLYNYIPKEYLPQDYGGEQPSLKEFKDVYEKELRSTKTKKLLIDAAKMISDESKRPSADINEDYLAGSFRKLDFD